MTPMTTSTGVDLIPILGKIARAEVPAGIDDPLVAARYLSGGMPVRVYASEPIDLVVPNLTWSDDPEDCDVMLIIHRGDPAATAAEIEQRLLDGRRVALVDLRYEGEGISDPELIPALINSTVYLSSLATFELSIERALAVIITTMRDGRAHRRYLAKSILYHWAWKGIVEGELKRVFGEMIPDEKYPRAEMQARSRMGAYLLRMRARGLRFFIKKVTFEGNRVENMRFELVAEGDG